MKFSALIPYKADYGTRDYIWSHVLKRYQSLFPQIEICLGIYRSSPFCRAKAINDAARKASGDVFIIVDTDIIYQPELIQEIAATISSHPWLIPFDHGWRLSRDSSQRLLAEGLTGRIQVNPGDAEINVASPGAFMNVMTRTCFERVRGLDERFLGWGGEDEALAMALDTLCGPHLRLPGEIYHLWHQPAGPHHDHYQANLHLHERYRRAYGKPGEMNRIIQERFRLSNLTKRCSI